MSQTCSHGITTPSSKVTLTQTQNMTDYVFKLDKEQYLAMGLHKGLTIPLDFKKFSFYLPITPLDCDLLQFHLQYSTLGSAEISCVCVYVCVMFSNTVFTPHWAVFVSFCIWSIEDRKNIFDSAWVTEDEFYSHL